MEDPVELVLARRHGVGVPLVGPVVLEVFPVAWASGVLDAFSLLIATDAHVPVHMVHYQRRRLSGVPEEFPLIVRLRPPTPSAVGHRGVGAAAAAALTLVIGLVVPAVRFCHRRGKLSSGPCEACGVGYFFLGAVFLFIFLAIMIYQPHIP